MAERRAVLVTRKVGMLEIDVVDYCCRVVLVMLRCRIAAVEHLS